MPVCSQNEVRCCFAANPEKGSADRKHSNPPYDSRVVVFARPTGVVTEGLTAVSIAALYDVTKTMHRDAMIENASLLGKSGGNRGIDQRGQPDGE